MRLKSKTDSLSVLKSPPLRHMDHFTHFANRLVRGNGYAKKASKLNLALTIEQFRERARRAVEAARNGERDHARRIAAICREDWKHISKWLKA